jgi:hypothetical protein
MLSEASYRIVLVGLLVAIILGSSVLVVSSMVPTVVYDGLKKGTHNFTVRSTDAAGNTGQDQFSWTVNPLAAVAAPGRQ